MGPCFKSYLSYKLDWPEMVHDRAKMNWPLIVSGDSLEIISSPGSVKKIWVFPIVVEPMTFWLLVQMVYH